MMGTSHAATGLLAGAAVGALAGTEVTDVVVCATVGAGAALLPDLDEPGSTVGRSLGVVSQKAAVGLRALSRRVYAATATPRDGSRDAGHRHLTHTLPAVLVFGVSAFLMAAVAPLGTVVVVFAMAALGAGTVAKSFRGWGRRRTRDTAAAILAVICATTAAFAPGGAAWLIGVTVAVGSLTHILGDWLTRSGVPLAWPVKHRGKRWWMFHSPLPFHTGRSPVEVVIRWVSLLGAPVMLWVAVPAVPAG
ncbi:metal-dependent hydrolase [Nocardiopsis sp. MG754419]|uniref:metal-dependent hydrolase n=1 Tax=Nocardiopsis sp. MG754419 TaxID=2259865 RepID=UPI001BAD5AD8|nr:metal-dependent hydrolase [Nocardiopsis sp. MG754419]MBR8745160.1 metal-dependent hydrolase [Nocardiopsis sp. MG754419]